MIQYMPMPVNVTNAYPMNPLISGGLGAQLAGGQSCRVKSSVKAASALTLTINPLSICMIFI